jgi:hypothetical protein
VDGVWELGDLYGRQHTSLAVQQITVVTFWSRVQSGISLPSRRGSAETLPMRSNPRRAQSKPRERTLSHCDDDHRIRRIDGDYLSRSEVPMASSVDDGPRRSRSYWSSGVPRKRGI